MRNCIDSINGQMKWMYVVLNEYNNFLDHWRYPLRQPVQEANPEPSDHDSHILTMCVATERGHAYTWEWGGGGGGYNNRGYTNEEYYSSCIHITYRQQRDPANALVLASSLNDTVADFASRLKFADSLLILLRLCMTWLLTSACISNLW